jgi:hypothetical protein
MSSKHQRDEVSDVFGDANSGAELIVTRLAAAPGEEWFDDDDPLSDEDKALLEGRLKDLEEYPHKSIPWIEAEVQLKARYGE